MLRLGYSPHSLISCKRIHKALTSERLTIYTSVLKTRPQTIKIWLGLLIQACRRLESIILFQAIFKKIGWLPPNAIWSSFFCNSIDTDDIHIAWIGGILAFIYNKYLPLKLSLIDIFFPSEAELSCSGLKSSEKKEDL